MSLQAEHGRFPIVGDGSGLASADCFYREELQLALRNRGLPLEALHYPITPSGLHYLLVHFDIPDVPLTDWRLTVDGLVSRPLSLTLAELTARPAVTIPVTLECAGNGRALLDPRPLSQPWLVEAVSTAEWTGMPLKTQAVVLAAVRGTKGEASNEQVRPLHCGPPGLGVCSGPARLR